MFLEKWWPRFPVLVFFLNCLMSPKKKWRMSEHYKHTILETCMGIDDPYVKKPRWRRKWNAISKMIKNGLAEGMVTRKLCVEVLDLVLTSFQTSFFSAPTVSKVQITDMLLLSTSFFSYPLPRSHRQGGFEKQMFPSTSYSFLFQIKAAAHVCLQMLYMVYPECCASWWGKTTRWGAFSSTKKSTVEKCLGPSRL